MKNNILINISLIISICIIGFVAVYSLIIDYAFTKEQVNYLFSLMYLVLALNFLYNKNYNDTIEERFKFIILKTKNIFISCVLTIIYALILAQSEVSLWKIFICLIMSLFIYLFSMVVFTRKVTLYLFWINFYLFMGVFIFLQFPNFQIDFLAKFNPLAGLIVNLIM
jgi:hypothetical protein